MSQEEDEWAVFGSDSDQSDHDDHDDYDDYDDDKEGENERRVEIPKKVETSHNDHKSDSRLIFFEKATSELCLFITKEFITSSRSIPLTLRYFSTPFSSSVTFVTTPSKTEVHDVEHSLDNKLWNDSICSKVQERGIQLVEPTTSCTDQRKYLSDAGNLFRIFEIREANSLVSYEQIKQDQCQQSYESVIRRTIAPGGLLLLTMYIHSPLCFCNEGGEMESINTSGGDITANRGEKDPAHLISQWKRSNGQSIFSDSVWDIEHASIVTHKTSIIDKSKNKVEEICTISLTKRPCTVNTLSCPWKTNSKLVLPSKNEFQHGSNEKHQQRSKLEQPAETWLQYERRLLADATVSLSIAELNESDQLAAKGVAATPPSMTKENIQKAVESIQKYGFVILPCLFSSRDDINTIHAWSNAMMEDFHSACKILKSSKGHQVDILNPGKDGTFDPISYKEMAMREDLRVDLRDGPNIKKLRLYGNLIDLESLDEMSFECVDDSCANDNDDCGTKPNVVDSKGGAATSTNPGQSQKIRKKFNKLDSDFEQNCKKEMKSLRFNPIILEIVRKLLNPKDDSNNTKEGIPMYKGNFGRYNFNGRGPNGTPQSLRVGQVGSVISLPRAGDQAIHADTPHLFELYDSLPCHYANLFILGDDGTEFSTSDSLHVDEDGNFRGDNKVGGTAFIHGSHKLTVTARLTGEDEGEATDYHSTSTVLSKREKARDEMHMRIIRPSLVMGDALIFDTRVLHFGLANQSKTKCRPMLYVNMTHSWFNDPKNWDDERSIFEN